MSTASPTATVRTAAESEQVRERPPLLRALGRAEPPPTVEIDGTLFHHMTTFKHDSWAATGLYKAADGTQIVCKFNRIQPVCGIPLRWLGRALARRELRMLKRLADEPLVPPPCGNVRIAAQPAAHCVAHAFVHGRPLMRHMPLDAEFFPLLTALLARVHHRGIAYIDLHKRENILVGDDGRPYLIDFQISLHLPARGLLGALLRALQRCDAYHLSKHVRRNRIDRGVSDDGRRDAGRPWTIRLHRRFARPLRTSRRQLLAWLGVRTAGGRAHTEVAPEVGSLQWSGQ